MGGCPDLGLVLGLSTIFRHGPSARLAEEDATKFLPLVRAKGSGFRGLGPTIGLRVMNIAPLSGKMPEICMGGVVGLASGERSTSTPKQK